MRRHQPLQESWQLPDCSRRAESCQRRTEKLLPGETLWGAAGTEKTSETATKAVEQAPPTPLFQDSWLSQHRWTHVTPPHPPKCSSWRNKDQLWASVGPPDHMRNPPPVLKGVDLIWTCTSRPRWLHSWTPSRIFSVPPAVIMMFLWMFMCLDGVWGDMVVGAHKTTRWTHTWQDFFFYRSSKM